MKDNEMLQEHPFDEFCADHSHTRLDKNDCEIASNAPDKVWFTPSVSLGCINEAMITSRTEGSSSYCACDLASAKAAFSWFAISKAFGGNCPTCYNQANNWKPQISPKREANYYALCFALGYAQNHCVVTKLMKDNPDEGVQNVLVDNPMSPMNDESFWRTTLRRQIENEHKLATELVRLVDIFYLCFRNNYCLGSKMENIGMQDEPYFKDNDCPDFLTMNSGIIQIQKYAEINCKSDLLEIHQQIMAKSEEVKNEIYRLLVNE